MTEDVVVKCKLLVQNRDVLKNEFEWASTNMIPLCAYYFAERGKKVDAVRMKECKDLLKKNDGVFTKVRGDVIYPFAAMLALEKNVNKAYRERSRVYQMLKSEYKPSVWLTLVSFLVAEWQEDKNLALEEVVVRAKKLEENLTIEDKIEEEQRCLFLALALSEKEDALLLSRLQECDQELRGRSLKDETRLFLSMILSLGDGTLEENVHKLEEALQIVKERQVRIGDGVERAALGLVAISEKEPAYYMDQIIKIDGHLKNQKGFQPLSLAANERFMYSVMLATAKERSSISLQLTLIAMLDSILTLTVLE